MYVSAAMVFLLCVLATWAQPALDLRIDCTEEALRQALREVASAGGGRITFKQRKTVLPIHDTIKFDGNDLILDGEDRDITVNYAGPDDCSQKEGQDRFIEIYGNRNVIRNLTLDRFPDGIHIQSGFDNLIENIRFPIVCEDAITNGGMGLEAFRTVMRGCYFENSEDKAVMINNGGSVTVEDCEFLNCRQPVRAGGRSGRHIIRGCTFRGAKSTGPRFNGGEKGMVIIFENNRVEDAQYGIRVYGDVEAIVRNNHFYPRPGADCAVLVFENAKVQLENNTIHGRANDGVCVRDRAQVKQ